MLNIAMTNHWSAVLIISLLAVAEWSQSLCSAFSFVQRSTLRPWTSIVFHQRSQQPPALLLLLLSPPFQRSSGSTRSSTSSSSIRLCAVTTTNEGDCIVTRPNHGNNNNNDGDSDEYRLAYRVVRPMALSSRKAAPIVVLHGGPSVPSDYLYPLADHIPYRAIVFYDQIGCGRSSEPTDLSCYSIEYALDDLEALLKKLGIRRFHLYGQSFGGILAYEYMKRQYQHQQQQRKAGDNTEIDDGCLSVILSSTPTNVSQVEQDAARLIQELMEEEEEKKTTSDNNDDDQNDNTIEERFRKKHQCRTLVKPQALVDAYAHAGTTWRGTKAIADYVATPIPPSLIDSSSSNSKKIPSLPSTLVLRGEYDFVTDTSGWKDVLGKRVRFKVLPDCSHHGLLENGPLYGDIVDSFFAEYD